jgi:hypothetical protein
MTERGDNKDALLDKLDNLMRSGRAQKRRDPPPLLTDAIPKDNESSIPTLTDIVSTPDTQTGSPANTADVAPETNGETRDGTALADEPGSQVDSDKDVPLEFERFEEFSKAPENADDSARQDQAETQENASDDIDRGEADDGSQFAPAVLHESISARLLAALDQEMSSLVKALPLEKDRLAVLHRSLRFALPELVRLRWLEPPSGDHGDTGGNDDPEPES